MTRTDHRKVKRVLDALPGKHLFLSVVDNRITLMSDMKVFQLESAMASFMSTNPEVLQAMKRAIPQAERILDMMQHTDPNRYNEIVNGVKPEPIAEK